MHRKFNDAPATVAGEGRRPYVFSVLPASRWQGVVVTRIGEWLLRSCTIASFPPAGCRQHAKHTPLSPTPLIFSATLSFGAFEVDAAHGPRE